MHRQKQNIDDQSSGHCWEKGTTKCFLNLVPFSCLMFIGTLCVEKRRCPVEGPRE